MIHMNAIVNNIYYNKFFTAPGEVGGRSPTGFGEANTQTKIINTH